MTKPNNESAPLVALGLSEREVECLHWTASGKTAWEVGKILGITERTANFHLGNVKKKLDVSTKSEAVAKYVEFRGGDGEA